MCYFLSFEYLCAQLTVSLQSVHQLHGLFALAAPGVPISNALSYSISTSGTSASSYHNGACNDPETVPQVPASCPLFLGLGLGLASLLSNHGTLEVAHCTCMAGLAETCSHIGAILHWVETAVPICDDTPCTSLEN